MNVKASRSGFRGRIISVDVEQVTLPNGAEVEFELIRHPGGAAVACVDANGAICLLRQYRHAVKQWLWELPAGKLDSPGEDPLVCARRELEEEAGVHARQWRSLGRVVSSPGVFTEAVHLFLATDLEQRAATPEQGELFEVVWMPLADAVRMALQGEVVDAKSVAGLCRARFALEAG